jgi:hypothetical protein
VCPLSVKYLSTTVFFATFAIDFTLCSSTFKGMNTVVTGDIRRGAEERATLSTIFSFSAVIISFAAFFTFSLPVQVQAADVNSCLALTTNDLGDTQAETDLGNREDEPSLAEVLSEIGYGSINTATDHNQTQLWDLASSTTSTNVTATLLSAYADNTNTLKYYTIDDEGNRSEMHDLFTVEVASSTASTTVDAADAHDESRDFTIADVRELGFAIVSEGKNGQETWYTENDQNPSQEDHSLVYDLGNNSYIVVFEDEPIAGAIEDEPDYQDMVVLVEVTDTACDTPNEPEEPTPSACFLPVTLGDVDNEVIHDSGEPTLNEVLNETGSSDDTFHNYNYGIDVNNDQKQYQIWQTGKSATLEVEVLLDDQFALYNNTFGYYTNGDIDTFSTTTDSTTGDTATVTVAASSSIGFAIEATTPDGSKTYRWSTESALNGGDDHVVVYQIADDEYILAFEDQQNLGDQDYQDLVVRVKMTNCDNGGNDDGGDDNGGDDGDNNGGGGDNGGGDVIEVGSGGNHDSGSHHSSSSNLRVSNEKAEQESLTSARITFDTNKRANCRVYYGTESVDDPDLDDDNLNYEHAVSGGDDEEKHEVIIDRLQAGETYYFRPNCEAGNDEALGDEVDLDLEQGEVLGAATCSPFLTTYMKRGQDNDLFEVMKLQAFLNTFEGENLVVSGTFDLATERAVNRFQMKYAAEVLNPWGYADNQPTGYVYITTQTKINEIYCHREIPFTSLEQQEIDLYRQYQALLVTSPVVGLGSNGVVTGGTTHEGNGETISGTDNNGTGTTSDGTASTSSSTDEVSSSTGRHLAGNNFLEKAASAVYLAFNDIVNFLLAPCFLLLILGILLGLLVVELYKGRSED